MQNQDDPTKNALLNACTEAVNVAIRHANANGHSAYWIMKVLLTAAGIFSYNMKKEDFFQAVNEFIASTRSVYPDYQFEPDPSYNAFMQGLKAMAMQEKQGRTVH